MGKRHQARELALKVLFQLEGSDDDPEEVLAYHAAEGAATADVAAFAGQLVRGVLANQERLDATLSEASDNWRLEQMAKVDRIVLRIAIYEITILGLKVPGYAALWALALNIAVAVVLTLLFNLIGSRETSDQTTAADYA